MASTTVRKQDWAQSLDQLRWTHRRRAMTDTHPDDTTEPKTPVLATDP